MTIMPMPQLKVRSISSRSNLASACSQAKTGGRAKCAKVDLGGKAVGQHARDVVGEAAAGDMGERLDGIGSANRFKDLPDIDAGRGEQRLRRV